MEEKTYRGHSWTWLTLSEVDIPVHYDTLRRDITQYGNLVQKLLAEEYSDGGLVVMEHTIRIRVKPIHEVISGGEVGGNIIHAPATLITYQKFLKLHCHALVCGGWKDKTNFERRYGVALVKAGLLSEDDLRKNEGKRYSWMEAVRNAKNTLRYMMKYVAKGVQLADDEAELLKRTKYVRTWGFLYGMKELTYDLICADCGAKCYVAFDDETCNRFEEENRNDLKVLRVLREVTGPPNKAEVA